MVYKSLSTFVERLKSAGELIEIDEQVDVSLEVTEIVDRLSKSKEYNKALFFRNTESGFPLLINAFGSEKRMAMALNVDSLDSLTVKINQLVSDFLAKPEGFRQKVGMIPKIARIGKWLPKKVSGKGACQQEMLDVIDMQSLPVLKCWPHDGGPFITLPCVHTIHPSTGLGNLGMYRMQIFDRSTVGMHWHKHKTGAMHFNEYKKLGKKMPVSVTLGGDPVYTFAATAPLPENIDEYLLAGFLRDKPVRLVKCLTNDLWVPEDVDFVIEGYVDPEEELTVEGPFGDHTGFYSLADLYPRMHVTAITHRKGAIYPTTIVGIPPMEDAYMAEATEKIFSPLIKLALAPEVVDMHMPVWGVAHNLVLVSINKQYEGQAFKVAQAFWGAGQMMFNKVLMIFDASVDLRDYKATANALFSNFCSSAQILLSRGPLDVLDHSVDVTGVGSKICIDATSCPNKAVEKRNSTNFLFHYCSTGKRLNFEEIKASGEEPESKIALVLEPETEHLSVEHKIWYLLNNIDPQRDIHINETGRTCVLIVDGRKKKHKRKWPNVIVMDKATINKVDQRWSRLFQIPHISSPSLIMEKIVSKGGAESEDI